MTRRTLLKRPSLWIGMTIGLIAVLISAVVLMRPATTSAAPGNPYLWPYNQPTNISFNDADVYNAWTIWRDDTITSNNAGGNGRYRVMGGVDSSSTVSEGQAYGILFASIFDEQDLLDGLFLFAKDHYNSNGIMDWHIGNPGQRIGEGGATDGEVDMALGLVNACVKVQEGAWPASSNGVNYCQEATNLINAIYNYEVDHPGGSPPAGLNNNPGNELIPGDMWDLSSDYPSGIVNLSYFPPGYFEVFGKFTGNESQWQAVIDRNYDIVDAVQAKPDNCSGLVPNWNQYDGDAQLVSWQPNNYSWWSWDAARFAWRIAVDQAWYARPEASETMNEIGGFFSSVGLNNLQGEYNMAGQATGGSGFWTFFAANAGAAMWAAPNPIATSCGDASGTLQVSPQQAYDRVRSSADNPNSYYSNAWRLFSMLLMTGNFPNFYEMANGGVVTPTATATSSVPSTPTNTPQAPTVTPTTPAGTGVCQVDYDIVNAWSGGFQANVTITNNASSAINGYTLEWTMPGSESITSSWNVTLSQSGQNVTASNPSGHWNGMLPANGGTSSFGVQGTVSGTAQVPTSFTLNGVACNGDGPATPVPTATSAPPTNTPVAPTNTPVAPTATSVPPTATNVPPTATGVPPTATVAPATATPVVPTATPSAGSDCAVDYTISDSWGSGFVANVTITNTGSSTISGYDLEWSYSNGEQITNAWNVTVSQSGSNVTASNPAGHWNGQISPGGTSTFGFQGTANGSVSTPNSFTLNGVACN